VFYRLISGLHASTTAHICENFHHPDNSWGPNLDMFIWRLGAFPDRMKNIYFTFVYLLRAANKASSFLSSYNYHTGHTDEDKKVQSLVKTLLSSDLVCSSTFDETTLFQGERAVLKREFMAKFRNISEIMDCVSCQTCKVHAKLQILGIATATKILITDDPKMLQGLQHNEISALLNTLFKFAESIQILHDMGIREKKYLRQLRGEPEEEPEVAPEVPKVAPEVVPEPPNPNTSLYALITVVVLITVATLYSINNPQRKPGAGSKKHADSKPSNETNNGERKGGDKVMNNHDTQDNGKESSK